MVTRILGAGLALLAFAVATIAGIAVHNPLEAVLSRALLAMVVFFAVGVGLGWVIQRVITEYLSDRQRRRQGESREAETKAPPTTTPSDPNSATALKSST